uniref:Uncharacterized protein n=1 Tax=Entomoneis paludosa TaxID=265537 RepID=A0A7S2YPK7_9STRA|mmetsp:Transcript_4172/g.8960  ORF Transcript_4172/g.8960 Transcript_4172/m.8960 type:complete len:473 (+) Transcript_4172:275-1693(+)|eukprot:CAMPEP_0172439172 /NCGR_PEP_ID=MMETSP1065-20121228/243_1 /TAXON_ID=265537 /ORGANISM="Amphiprora paludosa, Strain CCMP125" /LENGTH=472 /DNA_ID=CAMNT_0013187815 /DNA_START=181 /DNA_END=1599 /DNA_ORIENTATION=-
MVSNRSCFVECLVWALAASSVTAFAPLSASPLVTSTSTQLNSWWDGATSTMERTRTDSVFDAGMTRVGPRRDSSGRRYSDYMSQSDENYNYRNSGTSRRRFGNDYAYGGSSIRGRSTRWEPSSYDNYYSGRRYGNDYRPSNFGSRSWYDDTSFSSYGRQHARRSAGARWRPQHKHRWYEKTTDRGYTPNIQGGTRQTFSKRGGGYDDSQTVLELGSEGRPLYANVETWEGPDNTRASLNFYSQDGLDYGVRVLQGSRYGRDNWNDETVSIRNTGPMEYPMQARVDNVRGGAGRYASYGGGMSTPTTSRGGAYRSSSYNDGYVRESNGDAFRSYGGSSSSYGYGGRTSSISGSSYSSSYGGSVPTGVNAKTIQGGGATRHWQLSPEVQSVKVELHSQGLPIMARIELLQGPNNVKTLGEVYQEDGYERPFVCVLDTGDSEYTYNKGTIQIINEGPMEFPIVASVEAHEVMAYY